MRMRPRQVVHAFGGEDPALGGPWYHEVITRAAAESAGWSSGGEGDTDGGASDALAWVADYLDSYLYNPLWWAAGGFSRFKVSLLARPELVKLHFDDLASTAQVRHMWLRYQAGCVAACLHAARRNDVGAARHAVGVCLHAMQDFYAHSNWVDDPWRRERTWFDAAFSWRLPAVLTGTPLARTVATAATRVGERLSGLRPAAEPDLRVADPPPLSVNVRPVDLGVLADPRPAMHLYTGTYEQHSAHGFKHHGKLAFDCTLMRNLRADGLLDLFCAAISPASNTGICQRWRECRDGAVSTGATTIGGVPLPADVVYLEPKGIALDSKWLSRVNIAQRDIPPGSIGGEELFEKARALAERTSLQWLQQLDGILASAGFGAFWDTVRNRSRAGLRTAPVAAAQSYLGGYSEDLTQFEDPWRQPSLFLTAGAYPPAPTERDDDRWWLRLELRTDDATNAGTDADIRAVVRAADGSTRTALLDHGHERTPAGGTGENRLLEWNDFERGDRAVYVVGPLSAMPTSLELRNGAASAVDVVRAAWEDLKRAASDVVDGVVDVLLSIVGGHADYVGAAKATWSWAQLEAAATSGGDAFTLTVRGGVEGNYRITGRVVVVPTATGASVTVRFDRLHCDRESDWDRGTSDDEPFVLALVSSPAAGLLRKAVLGPYSGVDKGEVRDIARSYTVDVPRYGGLIVPVQVWESDDEGAGRRGDLLDEFASKYGAEIANERSAFLDALGRAIGPDWKLRSIDATAFKRARRVEVADLLVGHVVDAWIPAGASRHFGLHPQAHLTAWIPSV